MKTTFNKIFFWSFILIWFAAVLINIVTPYRSFSENENRYLSKFPNFSFKTIVNGEFMGKVEDYINDKFILRDNWISAQSVSEYLIGKREINGVFICKNALMGKINGPNDKYIKSNIEGINYFTSETKIPSSLMIVPSASEIQPYKLPLFANVWNQKNRIDEIYKSIESAKCIPLYDILSDHKNDYIYYRTDHHWTSYGAYLAYTEYCTANNLTPAEYSADTVSTSFNGTLYSSSGVRFIDSDTIEAFKCDSDGGCDVFDGSNTVHYDSIYFPEFLDKKDKYSYFMGTNQPIVTLYGKNENGPSLLMFKDSYAHCMTPMLLEHYSKITLVDLRYIKDKPLDKYIDFDDYNNALFVLSVDSFVNQEDLLKLTYLMHSNS